MNISNILKKQPMGDNKPKPATAQIIAQQGKLSTEVAELKNMVSVSDKRIEELMKIIVELDAKVEELKLSSASRAAPRKSANSSTTATAQSTAARFPTYTNHLVKEAKEDFEKVRKYINDAKFDVIRAEVENIPTNASKAPELIQTMAFRKYITEYLAAKPKDASEPEKREAAINDFRAAKEEFEKKQIVEKSETSTS